MSGLFGTGTSSLLAFQRALATTSHNIANINTEGYSRQRVDLETQIATPVRSGYAGKGVQVVAIERLTDQFANSRILQNTSAHTGQETHRMLASRLDNMVAEQSLSMTPAFNGFYNAMQDANANPGSAASREVVLSSAENVAARFRSLQQQLDNTQTEVNQRLSTAVTETNELTSAIAAINDRLISKGSSLEGKQPNDMLDKRDVLLTRLSQQVDIHTVEQDDGAINVYAGNGVALVVGNMNQELRAGINPIANDRLQVQIESGDQWQDIGKRLQGGTLGGLLAFENETLDPTMNELGYLALSMGDALNEQHGLGLDLEGNRGADIFSLTDPVAISGKTNTGNAMVTASFNDISQIEAAEYHIRYTGSDYEITRLSDGQTTPTSFPATIDGMDIDITGTPAAGDIFQVSPTRRAAATVESLLRNTDHLALSSPLRSVAEISNLSEATISDVGIVDIDDPGFNTPVDLVFTSSTTFDIVDSGGTVLAAGLSYDENTPVQFNGWEAQITGNPIAGDSFWVLPNTTAQGNNANGLAMANIQTQSVNGSTTTLNDSYSALVSRVGSQARTLSIRSEALNNIKLDSIARQQAVAGVNLDEEAVNLTRYEQAYQASAQIIATADSIFQTLLGALAR